MAEMHVRSEDRGAVRVITLDAGKVNALVRSTVRDLRTHVGAAERDPALQALVLTGRGGAFSAGLDTGTIAAGGRAAQELLGEMGELLVTLYGSRLRVVAACTGHAVAAGAMLLLVSDVRIGAEGPFRIGFSEVGVGLPLPELPILLARERLSPRHLQAATMLGRLFDPAEAVVAGFLDRVVPPADVLRVATENAELLAGLRPEAYAETLRGVRGPTLDRMRAIVETLRAGLD